MLAMRLARCRARSFMEDTNVIEITCDNCGNAMRLPVEAAGQTGRCSRCSHTIQVPGRTKGGLGGASYQEDSWGDLLKDSVSGVSGPVNSEFRAASRQVFIPPIMFLGAWVGLLGLGKRWQPELFDIIGAQSTWDPWKTLAYVVLIMFVSNFAMSGASVAYSTYTGRVYTEDRIGFAKAGGYDIGHIVQLVAVLLLLGIFAALDRVPFLEPYGHWRRPWVFAVVLTFLSFLLGMAIASGVYRARFGAPRKRAAR